jgi:hemerythrin
MAFMDWTEKYSVGIAVFDDEHKKLIAIVNTLHHAVSAGTDKLELQRICDGLVDYTISHFRHEEEYFAEWGFPEAGQHIAEHDALRQQVFGYRNQIRTANNAELAFQLLRFVRGWLSHHILVEDKKYGRFLLQKGFG